MKKVLRRSIVIGIALLVGWIYRERTTSSTIGIIGGADGPTAIFVTSSPALLPLIFTIIAAILIGIALFLILRRRKQ